MSKLQGFRAQGLKLYVDFEGDLWVRQDDCVWLIRNGLSRPDGDRRPMSSIAQDFKRTKSMYSLKRVHWVVR